MRVYQQRIYTSPRSGEVGRGSGRVGPDEAQQIVTPSRESTLPGPESPTLPQAAHRTTQVLSQKKLRIRSECFPCSGQVVNALESDP